MNCLEKKKCLSLKNLKHGKSTGPDRIGNLLLQKCHPTIGKSLALIFQTCVNKGKYPTQWKLCQVTPIFKEGNRADVSCYRPISLLCCGVLFDEICKIVKGTLNPNQFGFRRKRSATVQLSMFLDKVYNYNDDNTIKQFAILYIDFSKALYKVLHSKLIGKLQNVCLGGKLLSLICSYLSERKQMVTINKELSSPRKVISGLQLGSLLFLIFINVLPDKLPKTTDSFSYADDFKVVTRNQSDMNFSTKGIESWLSSTKGIENKMLPNLKKSHVLNIRAITRAAIYDTPDSYQLAKGPRHYSSRQPNLE